MLRILDYLKVGTLIYSDVDGVFAADDAYCNILELPLSEILGRRMQDLTAAEDRLMNQWLLDNALRTLQRFTLRKRYIMPDGRHRWVENRYTVVTSISQAPFISMVSRLVEGPLTQDALPPSSVSFLPYIADMADQLADMAKAAKSDLISDLMKGARLVIDEDERF